VPWKSSGNSLGWICRHSVTDRPTYFDMGDVLHEKFMQTYVTIYEVHDLQRVAASPTAAVVSF